MSNILFDEEQQKQLRANHWVKSVTEKSISFTEDFKVYFINEYNLGKRPKQIFKDAGFDINMLGDKRIEQCTARYKRQNKRIEGFHDTRTNNSGRGIGKELSIDEENELLKKQNAKLQQELEFLKKMEYLARQAKKSKQ